MSEERDIQVRDIDGRAMSALEAAKALVVSTENDYVGAGMIREALKGEEKKLNDAFDHLIKEAHSHHKSLVAEKAKHFEPIAQARELIKSKMFKYEDALEQERRAEEARLAAEAKKKAEDDLLAAAEKAKTEGRHDEAEAILSEPVVAPTVVVPTNIPKVQGHTRRMINKFRIVDANKIRRDFCTPDEVKIGGLVRSMGKSAESIVGGIEVFQVAC